MMHELGHSIKIRDGPNGIFEVDLQLIDRNTMNSIQGRL